MVSVSATHALARLEERIGHTFSDPALIRAALTHSSAGLKENYERLEFLGDRVLGLAVAELLYARFQDETEGDLARRLASLVQGSFLAVVAQDIELGAHIVFSEAEAHAGGAENENILADVFEALIGALYLDGGFEKCRHMIETLWAGKLDTDSKPPQHPKTRLQEWAQSQGLPLPDYKIVGQHGPDHAPVFDIELTVKGFSPVRAQGRSRQVAERAAAEAFLTLNEDQIV
jgi:ribonuclease III